METNDTKKECLMVSEASNFNSIFGKKEEYEVKSVVIPLVQRDYAQGRVSPSTTQLQIIKRRPEDVQRQLSVFILRRILHLLSPLTPQRYKQIVKSPSKNVTIF